MPRPLPGGGLPLLWNHGRKQRNIHQQQTLTWTTVIQFSARHLFCSAHAPPKVMEVGLPTPGRHKSYQQIHAAIPRSVRTTRGLSTATTSIDTDLYPPDQESQHCSHDRSTTEPSLSATQNTPLGSERVPPARKTEILSRDVLSAAHSSSTWNIPVARGHGSDPELVRIWPSTSVALSRFYESFRLYKSASASTSRRLTDISPLSTSAGSIELVMTYYNHLSRLQACYDTIIVPRRDTRTLFLLQGKEPKTTTNLKQLLRIASDLIWLNGKERRRRRRPLVKSTASTSDPESATEDDYVQRTLSRSRANNFHGLRVSEYTILMEWIGSTPQPQTVQGSSGAQIGKNDSVSKVWAIWQDFTMTGMKADVVLCTSLIDLFLKAGEFDRADQIWRHLQPPLGTSSTPSSDNKTMTGSDSTSDLDEVSRTLNSVSNTNQPTGSKLGLASSILSTSISSKARVLPNVQTLSVLMQAHIRDRDLAGVARIYQAVLEHQQSSSKDRGHLGQLNHRPSPANTDSTLLNQILTVLLDIGETVAAKEIYAQARTGHPGLDNYTTDKQIPSRPKASHASEQHSNPRTPMHHRTSQRRSEQRLEKSQSRTAPTQTRPSTLPQPDLSTVKLLLRRAQQSQDLEWETEILKDLDRLATKPDAIE